VRRLGYEAALIQATSDEGSRSFCDFDAVFDAGFLQVQIAL
jgi:hypothetical protein